MKVESMSSGRESQAREGRGREGVVVWTSREEAQCAEDEVHNMVTPRPPQVSYVGFGVPRRNSRRTYHLKEPFRNGPL